jgi:lysozyme family protein
MADFNLAIPVVLKNEGGLVDNPNDPGGLTKFGISQRAYPNLDIRNLTVERATEIYHRDFWKFGGIIDQDFATKLFDSYVNMEHKAIKIVQNLVGVLQDGLYGPETEKMINGREPKGLLIAYKYALCEYYQNLVKNDPSLGVFIVGWLRRANG